LNYADICNSQFFLQKPKYLNPLKAESMEKFLDRIAVIGFLTFLLSATLSSQEVADTAKMWRVETTDGNEFLGSILSKNSAEIQLNTEKYGVLTLRTNSIRSITEIQPAEIKQGSIWMKNIQDARYFYAPNGYGLKKGEGYYQNTWVLFNQASVGITNNISIGAGIVPLFLFAGAPTPIWLTPKFSLPVIKDKLSVGAGVLIGGILSGEIESGLFGITYGVGTIGNRDKNITLGAGYGFSRNGWADKPMITLSGMIRVSKKGYFLSENYYLSIDKENIVLLSLGGRTVWPKVSLDYGFVVPVNLTDAFIAIPWLGFTIPLSRK
jgi:hypothetical protein